MKSPVLRCVLVILFFSYPLYYSSRLFWVLWSNDTLSLVGIVLQSAADAIRESGGDGYSLCKGLGLINFVCALVLVFLGGCFFKSVSKTIDRNIKLNSAGAGSCKSRKKGELERLLGDVARSKGKSHHAGLFRVVRFMAGFFLIMWVVLILCDFAGPRWCPELYGKYGKDILAYWCLTFAGFFAVAILLCAYYIYIFSGDAKPEAAPGPVDPAPAPPAPEVPASMPAAPAPAQPVPPAPPTSKKSLAPLFAVLGIVASAGAAFSVVYFCKDSFMGESKGKTRSVKVRKQHKSTLHTGDVAREPLLVEAVERGDARMVRFLLMNGASPDCQGAFRGEPLRKAVSAMRGDIVSLLVAHGANPRYASLSPMHMAVINGDVEEVRSLLRKRADADASDMAEHTPLYWAAYGGQTGIVRVLLEEGMHSISTCRASAALAGALENGQVEVARILLAKGVEPGYGDGREILESALKNGRKEAVAFILQHKSEFSLSSYTCGRLLETAAKAGDSESAILLLESGAEMSLHDAAENGYKDIALYLVEHGADINGTQSYSQAPPLYKAVENGHVSVAEALLKAGANVNVRTQDGYTPLHKAVEKGNVELVRILLEAGADTSAKTDYRSRTPIDMLRDNNSVDRAGKSAIEDLFRRRIAGGASGISKVGAAAPEGDGDGISVMDAVLRLQEYGILEYNERTSSEIKSCVDEFLQNYARYRNGDADITAYPYLPVLVHLASATGKDLPVSCLKAFITAGASLDARYKEIAALMYAVSLPDQEVAKLLLEAGADVNIQDGRGATPLLWAVLAENTAYCKLFLEHNADPDKHNVLNNTPLHIAAEKCNAEIVKLLLEHGAKTDPPVEDNASPLGTAVLKGDADIVKLLLEHEANPNPAVGIQYSPLLIAVRGGKVEIAKLLLEHGSNPNQVEERGVTLLMKAAEKGHKELVGYLLEKGADVDSRSEDGRTALLAACFNDQMETAKILVEHGADVDMAADNGQTPLGVCFRELRRSYNSGKWCDLAVLFIAKGADVRKTFDRVKYDDADKRSVLRSAVKCRNVELTRALIKGGVNMVLSQDVHNSLLHEYANDKSYESVKTLLDAGADVSVRNDEKRTPLYAALYSKDERIVAAMLAAGASVNVKDKWGITPMQFAKELQCSESIISMLKKASSSK